jgi:hypothetical protein
MRKLDYLERDLSTLSVQQGIAYRRAWSLAESDIDHRNRHGVKVYETRSECITKAHGSRESPNVSTV